MRNFYKISFIFLSLLCSVTFAANFNTKSKWFCETNASSPTTDAEKRADEMMSKTSQTANSAFNQAVKHCRDCNKITCTLDNANANTNTTQ